MIKLPIGGDDTMDVDQVEKTHPYDYDLVVIGGGSGGLACSKAAAELGKKVAVLDFVKPSPQGTSWGLGGTCVNVGCIPKKLMHQAALHREGIKDAQSFGWKVDEPEFEWKGLVEGVTDHIKSLNWGYRVQLREKSVKYLNAYGTLLDAHTIKTVNKKGKETTITTDKVVIATGGRPRMPDIPGAVEHCISSDDLFWLKSAPGKTLVVGASYVALECAGFLTALGYDTTVMVRSILLRGFDTEISESIGNYMEAHGTNFIRPAVPTRVDKGDDGRLTVTYSQEGETKTDVFDTVLFAIGRNACTTNIGLESVGVNLNPKNGKVIHNDVEQTSVDNIYAIGDVLDGKPELTPVAIQAGQLLAKRLFDNSTLKMDYTNIPTTVFTPLEYGCCGLSEEQAIEQYGEDNLEVYHQQFTPLEWTVPHRPENKCYIKLICLKHEDEKIVGFHILSPNAGEITQGFGLALTMGAKKSDMDRLVGIHPTNAENFTTLKITKSSGQSAESSGC